MKTLISIILCLATVLIVLVSRAVVHQQLVNDDPPGVTVTGGEIEETALQLHFHERRPYYVQYKNDVYGMVASPVAKALKEAEIDFEWVQTPAGRQLDMIRANTAPMCALGWFKTPQRQRYARFSRPVYRDKGFIVITRVGNVMLEPGISLDALFFERRLKLLIKSGYSYGAMIDNKLAEYDPWRVATTADNLGMLEMILDNRADYCFMTEDEAYDLLVHSHLDSADFKTIYLEGSDTSYMRYLICSKKVDQTMMDRMNAAIAHFLKIPEKH